ncbi:hypothetical protein [Delftia acidovorans]|uniref:hypothetical protein n=1 Tax=Delftia acidovorans TaxID=80866 RepID=UPI0030ECF75B
MKVTAAAVPAARFLQGSPLAAPFSHGLHDGADHSLPICLIHIREIGGNMHSFAIFPIRFSTSIFSMAHFERSSTD